MLHLISDSSLSLAIVERIACGDDVVLLTGSAWSAYQGHQDNSKLSSLISQDCEIYILQDILAMFGIQHEQLLPGVHVIEYSDLVALTVKNSVIQTWC